MLGIVGLLLFTPSGGLFDGLGHRIGDGVRVHQHATIDIPRSPSGRLRQGAVGAQEALLVGVHDRHQGDLRQVQTLAQQVDPHEHVDHPLTEVADDFDPVQSLDFAVDVGAGDAQAVEIAGEFLRHALGQGGHQDPVPRVDGRPDFADEVVHLVLAGAHLDGRIE